MTAPAPQERIYFDPLPAALRGAIRFSRFEWDVGAIFHAWKRDKIPAESIIANMRDDEAREAAARLVVVK